MRARDHLQEQRKYRDETGQAEIDRAVEEAEKYIEELEGLLGIK